MEASSDPSRETPLLPAPPADRADTGFVLWRRTFGDGGSSTSDLPKYGPPTKPTVFGALFIFAIGALMVAGIVQIFTGSSPASVWVKLASPFLAFIAVGLVVHGAIHLTGVVRGRSTDDHETRFWQRWQAGGVKAAGFTVLAALATGLAAGALNIIKNPPPASVVIIVLLVLILAVLLSLHSRLKA